MNIIRLTINLHEQSESHFSKHFHRIQRLERIIKYKLWKFWTQSFLTFNWLNLIYAYEFKSKTIYFKSRSDNFDDSSEKVYFVSLLRSRCLSIITCSVELFITSFFDILTTIKTCIFFSFIFNHDVLITSKIKRQKIWAANFSAESFEYSR